MEKAKDLGHEGELQRLESGETVEVSTGAFVDAELKAGSFDEEEFHAIWRDVKPDHLALLPEGTIGACSVEDGAGAPRLNMRINECGCERCKAANATMHPGESKGVIERVLEVFRTQGKMSDEDKRFAIESALRTKEDFFFTVATFDDSVVFERGFDGAMFRRSVSISDDGVVTLGDDAQPVRPVTDFVDVKTNQEVSMDIKQRVAALIANKATRFTEDDSKWLENLEESQLKALEPVEVETPPAPAAEEEPPAPPAEADEEEEEEVTASEATPQTTAEYIAAAPAEMQSVLQEGLSLQKARRAQLTETLTANSRNQFGKEDLEKMDLQTLERLAHLSGEDDFSGAAPAISSETEDNTPAPMPSLKDKIIANRSAA